MTSAKYFEQHVILRLKGLGNLYKGNKYVLGLFIKKYVIYY